LQFPGIQTKQGLMNRPIPLEEMNRSFSRNLL
jgi:hypothetical protein